MKTLRDDILMLINEMSFIEQSKYVPVFLSVTGHSRPSYHATVKSLISSGFIQRNIEDSIVTFALTSEGKARIKKTVSLPVKAGKRWDNRFRLLLSCIPESQRRERDNLRNFLEDRGFGRLFNSVWVFPHDIPVEITEWLKSGRYDRFVFTFTAKPDQFGTTREIFENSWNLDDMAKAYNDFICSFKNRVGLLFKHLKTLDNYTQKAFLNWMLCDLESSFKTVFSKDPFLPSEYLPANWPGRNAGTYYKRTRKRLENAISRRN